MTLIELLLHPLGGTIFQKATENKREAMESPGVVARAGRNADDLMNSAKNNARGQRPRRGWRCHAAGKEESRNKLTLLSRARRVNNNAAEIIKPCLDSAFFCNPPVIRNLLPRDIGSSVSADSAVED